MIKLRTLKQLLFYSGLCFLLYACSTGNNNKGLGSAAADPSMQNFLDAKFPFPPPECHTSYELSDSVFADCKRLGDVSERITTALRKKRYPYQFMSVPNGFVIVTQMEQYAEDGSILQEEEGRWADTPKNDSFSWSIDYLKSLMFPNKCLLRVFVFVVTSQNFSSDKETRVSKEEAADWYTEGVNRLPIQVASKPFNEQYGISLLLYEFEVPESNHQPEQNCPTRYPALEHLERSGLSGFLR